MNGRIREGDGTGNGLGLKKKKEEKENEDVEWEDESMVGEDEVGGKISDGLGRMAQAEMAEGEKPSTWVEEEGEIL